ncbi:MAG TPA: hypothetical protein VI819_02830 [Patescibacteria group bacterium]|nr:hypothetical protein [Patescibacteria group bacterium]
MERRKLNQLLVLIIIFGLATVLKRWYNLNYVLVWLGALLGFYLPNIDYILYAFVIRPQNSLSLEIKSLIKNKKFLKIGDVAKDLTQFEKLIFHTAYFQVIFLVLTFFVVSSSGSLFGKGLVYAASLKLLLEQIWEFRKNKNLSYWFSEMNLELSSDQTKAYLLSVGFALLLFILMF